MIVIVSQRTKSFGLGGKGHQRNAIAPALPKRISQVVECGHGTADSTGLLRLHTAADIKDHDQVTAKGSRFRGILTPLRPGTGHTERHQSPGKAKQTQPSKVPT